MSRKHRVYFPGAVYHITNRGNRRSDIFFDDRDRRTYLRLLEDTRSLFPFQLHSYCLMSNHTHLLLETINHHPKEIMKMLNSRYAIYFNNRHNLDGHVFQGRYGAEVMNSEMHFLEVSRYIHLNPVVAGMVKSPEDYPWSSYLAFIFNTQNQHVTTDTVLSYFHEPRGDTYRSYVEGKLQIQQIRELSQTAKKSPPY